MPEEPRSLAYVLLELKKESQCRREHTSFDVDEMSHDLLLVLSGRRYSKSSFLVLYTCANLVCCCSRAIHFAGRSESCSSLVAKLKLVCARHPPA